MASYNDFVHVTTGPAASAGIDFNWPGNSSVTQDYFENSKGPIANTLGLIVDSIRRNHPKHHVTITRPLDYIGLAASRDDISCTPSIDFPVSAIIRDYIPPARRFGDESDGTFYSGIQYGCFDYVFQGTNFLLYAIHGVDGVYPATYYYVLTPTEDASDASIASAQKKADELLAAASRWENELHDEVLVFDQGFWQKSKDLYNNIQKANWEDVILEKEKKKTIINDVLGFFKSADRYAEFGVPWKRGVIFYGPPGNGKTISTKALMHDISKRTSPQIDSLYVKTFNSFMGPEYGIRSIFEKARQMAPCLLIFEDIDSLVGPGVRSYFLNEVDGLESNHGILMIGSTNHLERLDPGIAKRPSRFDRKYIFDNPSEEEREMYSEYWRHKLSSNKKIDFPKALSAKIASITKSFSFAYMKEAFVATLLVIVANHDTATKDRGYPGSYGGGDGDEFEDNTFWKELKKQVENLRREMEDEDDESLKKTRETEEPKSTLSIDDGVFRGHSHGPMSRRPRVPGRILGRFPPGGVGYPHPSARFMNHGL